MPTSFFLPSFLSFACLPTWPASGPANSTSTQTHPEWYGRVAVQQFPHRVSTNSPTRQWRISAPDPLSEIQPPTASATEWCDADLRVVSDIPASSLADQRTASWLEAVRGGDICALLVLSGAGRAGWGRTGRTADSDGRETTKHVAHSSPSYTSLSCSSSCRHPTQQQIISVSVSLRIAPLGRKRRKKPTRHHPMGG